MFNNQQKNKKPVKSLRNYALYLLARREYSSAELREKLSGRTENGDEVEPVLRKLKSDNLQSDERFTESLVRYRVNNYGRGPLSIKMELRNKGISDSLTTLNVDDSEYDWNELAREALHKKYKKTTPDSLKEKAKWIRFLSQRGFSLNHIYSAFR